MKKGIIFILVLMFTVSWAFAEKGAPIQYDPADYPAPVRQGGETVDDATVIGSLPYNDTGTTAGYVDDYDEVCPYTGSTSPDVVYSFTPTTDIINGIVTTCNIASYDTKLYIYENTVTPGVPFACNDDYDGCTGYTSQLEDLTLTAGNTYYIVVDGYGGASGNYEIDITGDSAVSGTIEGTVYLDGGTGNVEDATVSAGGVTTNPAADGTYSLEVMVGTYDVTALLGGYESDVVADVVVTEGNITSGVDLTLTYVPATLDPVVNLAVDTDTGLLTWEAPGTPSGFYEDFEGTFPPAGWLKLSPDGGTGWEPLATGTTPLPGWTGGEATACPDGGNWQAYATWTTGGAVGNDQWLITPQITVQDGDMLDFWMIYYYDSYMDYVEVLISTTVQNDVSAFDIVVAEIEFPTGSSTEWAQYTYDLTDFVAAGTEVYIAFREIVTDNLNDGSAISLDNVLVGTPAECTAPVVSTQQPSYGTRASNYTHIPNTRVISTRDLLGYNVYLDGVFIEFTTDVFYLLSGLENGVEYIAGVEAVYDEGESDIVEITFVYTGGSEAGNVIVAATQLNDNYPNPFNPVTNIAYSIKDAGNVIIEVYNLKGQLVKTLVDEVKETGNHVVIWNGTDNSNKSVSSGVYFYKLSAANGGGKYTSTKKMILMK